MAPPQTKFRTTHSDLYLSKNLHILDLVREAHWVIPGIILIKTKENKDTVLDVTVKNNSPFFPCQKRICQIQMNIKLIKFKASTSF